MDELDYYEKNDRDLLMENIQKLDTALNDSTLVKSMSVDDMKDEEMELKTVIGWDVEDIAVEFDKV